MDDKASRRYIGRFAPSPTGPLHFGSLVAALASFLDARSALGRWLVRIEDIDPPREEPGASAAILSALEAHGLHWDDDVRYQSQRLDTYTAIIDDLTRSGYTFHCACSRRTLKGLQVYPGTCRERVHPAGEPMSLRLRSMAIEVSFDDLIQGPQQIRLQQEVGDFIIRRRDALIAYQLAVAVDDLDQGITRVVRGIDLLDSSFKQIYIMGLLGKSPPAYAHIPVITDPHGSKLSKQSLAPAVDCAQPQRNLCSALTALGHKPPPDLWRETPATILAWAIEIWQIARIPCVACITQQHLAGTEPAGNCRGIRP